jgi:leukotriene-A4 hydrolase
MNCRPDAGESAPRRMLITSTILLFAMLGACGKPPPPAPPAAEATAIPVSKVLTTADAQDTHSFARPLVARVTHVDVDLVADFASKTLAGTATLSVESAIDSPTLTLDAWGLQVEDVRNAEGNELAWSMGEEVPLIGSPLAVELGQSRTVVIRYRTRPDAESLQWLAPAQTAGGQHPYLFSQGQAILTRTWLPTQDSPGIRQTWSARIAAPEALTVVMSAAMLGPEPAANGQRVWRFRMDEPVAPYLIAFAIGDLAFRELGTRTGVWSEPSVVDAAAREFSDVEAMMQAAEALYGPYRWGRYDLLILPPSFPWGGMENPRLTFATPTIIAGDKSLVSLVAHELAHSWSGNLVSNATWADFWLNEGFTSYAEGRIVEAVYGADVAAMNADREWDDLQETFKQLGGMTGADTRLHIDLAGRNPDDGVTSIPYEKGAVFLRTIEAAVGREEWDAWLRAYFDRHAFQPQTSAGFLADLRQHLIRGDASLEQKLKLDQWVYSPGLPDNAVHVPSEALKQLDAAAAAFAASREVEANVAAWSTQERVRFLSRLPRELSTERLAALTKLLALDTQRNSEVQFAWLRLAIASRYEPAMPQLERFLTSMGRRKFVLPLFTDLMGQGRWGQAIARRVYAQARPGYHFVTSGSVDKVVTAR